jgi:uncharacterized membrane protein
MKRIARWFVQGCLVIAPIAITVYVVYLALAAVAKLMPGSTPLVGFAVGAAVVTLVGFFASSVVGKAVVSFAEGWLGRVPLVKLLYNSIKDLIGAFVGETKSFDRPVMVSLVPGSSAKVLGFMTREKLAFLDDHVAVYFPQSYNFAGNVVVCRRDIVEPIDVESADLMAFIVSGGVSPTRREGLTHPAP